MDHRYSFPARRRARPTGTPLLGVCAIVIISAIFGAAHADTFAEGVDYTLIKNAPKTLSSEPVEVIDVFSYVCPHCAAFHPLMQSWEKTLDSSQVHLIHVPVMFGMRPPWQLLARGYFAAEQLRPPTSIHHAVFDLLWKSLPDGSEPRAPRSIEDVADIYQRLGLDRSAFIRAATSARTETRLQQTANLMMTLEVTGTPEVIVGRHYRVIPDKNVPLEKVLRIVDFLIRKERP